jgi:hypothetical protein
MPVNKKRVDFFETEEGLEFKHSLLQMVADSQYNTDPTYSSNTKLYPNHLIPFVNKHMDYLVGHPSTDPQHYLSNLRIITRTRS